MPQTATKSDRLLKLADEEGILRPRDVEAEGISRKYLSRLVEQGELTRIGRGLYQRADHEVTEHHSLAVTAKRVPKATICLLSALEFHGLTTQSPFDIWAAIGHKDREPSVDALSLRVVRMSGEAHTEGIEEHEIEGVTVPIYSAAKTVADCFKFRSRVGLDVAIEALRDYTQNGGSMDRLWDFADVCRVRTVIRPYMEAMV
ncbi:type IV toxin-antitoxin system AbiEi family antitoxin domain-containing protein [Salinibacter ruber]|uniref:type IV toxin-antitoxin system AbiEi family antitoxin domain-containing protein n=1 Tax=Salinibacter ruber TaxID=146919 RepID=UPI002167A7F8|nr:AbiEi antitoxin N-terminal domain-containing protein [Salinibacter ruber]MCS4038727.1 putative transcriptional regulator of viral defense system [Salinibacter ruber]